MLDTAIQNFLDERKKKWLKPKITGNTTDEEKEAFEAEATEKFSLEICLPFEATRAKQIGITSHPAKYTHPDIKKDEISFITNPPRKAADGFVRTGNVDDIKLDAFGGAAGLAAYAFLTIVLKDGKTVLQHLEEETEEIKNQLDIPENSFAEMRSMFLKVRQSNNGSTITDGRLKQIFFPVKDHYHLLSILTPSGLMYKLKERINDMHFSDEAKEAREARKANQPHEKGFPEVYGLSVIGYGGTKPQNISVLNSQNGGKAYLLSSMPPELSKWSIQPPRVNFFSDSLWPKAFKGEFLKFHDQLISEVNNSHVRKRRDWIMRDIFYQVADRLWMIRYLDGGWSDSDYYRDLPEFQKIWLDQQYKEDRKKDLQWFESVRIGLALWFRHTYSILLGNKAMALGDDHLGHIKTIIDDCEEALR